MPSGTHGAEFAGATMRFWGTADGAHCFGWVFIKRQDMRFVGAWKAGIIDGEPFERVTILTSDGAEYSFEPDEGSTVEELRDDIAEWAWSGSVEWEQERRSTKKKRTKRSATASNTEPVSDYK